MVKLTFYEFENFRLDVKNEKLFKDNQQILLTNKAFLILQLLINNAGKLVKKEQIITEIWQDSFIEDANITQQIYLLRKALGNNIEGKPFIETLPKKGYSFTAEVRKITEEADFNSLKQNLSQENQNISDIKIKPKSKSYFYAFGIFLCLFLLIGAFYYQSKNKSKETSIKSIAVLPFRNLNPDKDESKLGFGLTDAIINNLSKQQKIPVRSISAVFQYADKDNFDTVEAGKNLQVDAVLEGNVQSEGEQTRVSVRMLKTDDGSTIWAETFNEKSNQIFTLQDSISTKVAQSLSMYIAGWENPPINKQTTNPEAFRFYQLGVYFANVRNKESMEKAVLYFQKAIELDPNYALSYAMLADTYNWLNEYADEQKSKELIEKSEEASKKALALDNTLAEAHISFAFVQFAKYKDNEAGQISLEKAVQLAPYNSVARLHYGWTLLARGDLDGAYNEVKLANEYAPLSATNNMSLCSILIYKRDYQESFKACERASDIQPTLPFINIQKANLLFLMGKNDEAIDLLNLESKDETQKYYALGNLGYIYAKLGRREEAEKIYLQLNENKESYNKYSDLTLVGFTLGKKEEALKNFKIMLEKSPIVPSYLLFDPFWEELFKDSDFQKLSSQNLKYP